MSPHHPPRLHDSLYLGVQRYFLTICCDRRRRFFDAAPARRLLLRHLQTTSQEQAFAVIAYCLMPDHLHLVVEGQDDGSDLQRFVWQLKQRTGFEWKKESGQRLWQASFYDHVLRDSESTQHVVRYVLENPVRAGIASTPGEYEHSGSLVYERDDLIEWAFGWNRPDP